ncbi:TcpQ domain-containing protein [Ralstonia insidiosa]|jgi:hypothetical protein|uniref:Toxin co-regulated pilus biosynthesis protein Q C-terminal domain-containing protein n=2 Tax=Ralstonia TaxID=48736 RepID=A0A192A753_9RALS|nr:MULTISPECIES: TcpQ domain-containing protein [Ralstonia]KMW44829.1 hypothetical protein AC240_22980 [Ralstonia sp. MD27]ANJ76310.1 hypothetical protein A9Y76_27280 [Ralstonia insidiosa]MBA9846725.1 hypothetical protein [Ralstonia pickettii]MBA9852123.1 hypothetical protein [Ralstonia pickettii]MBA9869841.1 hypothetical protein [Ralstonia insidiosa]
MKKLTLLRLGAMAALAITVQAFAAQEHKNQAFVPKAGPTTAQATVAAPTSEKVAPIGRAQQDFIVRESDENFRKLIDRWAKEAGWHALWDVDRDINITGEHTWTNMGFVDAVRATLHTTERGDLAVHGCYYANNWVQVVRLTTPCKK